MDKRTSKLFDRYNAEFWDGELPSCEVEWVDLPETTHHKEQGRTLIVEEPETDTLICRIFLDNSLREISWTYVKLTLLHEMAHVRLYPYMKHGRKFQEEMLRLAQRGAFTDIW